MTDNKPELTDLSYVREILEIFRLQNEIIKALTEMTTIFVPCGSGYLGTKK